MNRGIWRKASASIGMANCVEVSRPEWRKASASANNPNCVEVRGLWRGSVGIRDSKLGEASPVLDVAPDEFAAFLKAAKSGALDL